MCESTIRSWSSAYAELQRATTDWTGTTTTQVDALGRVVEVTDKLLGATQYAYGPFGALWTVTGPDGAVTLSEHDAYGRVRHAIDPDRGETFTDYNGFDEATGSLDARGWSYAFKYDALGRLVERDDHDGSTTWAYDTAPHGIGRVAAVTSPTGNVKAYTYDPLSRPASVALTVEGETFTSRFGYDDFGRLHDIVYPQAEGVDPLVVLYEQDTSGNLVTVRDNATGTAYWSLDFVDGMGRATLESLNGGATTTHRDYDRATGATTRILTAAGATTLQDLRYGYDASVRLTSRADGLQPRLGGVLTERFYYDALDRLTCAAFDGGVKPLAPAAAPPSCALSLQYQPSGNIDVKSDVGTYTYDPKHPHAVSGIAGSSPIYGYDETGNQTSRPGASIAYTAFDLPSTMSALGAAEMDTSFDYDGDQKRIRKTVGGDETIYAGDLYERVTGAMGVQHLYFIPAGSATVVLTRAQGAADAVVYVHGDVLGSADVVSDGNGGVIERRSYDAFGARRNPQGWQAGAPPIVAGATALGFAGQEGDEELGLVNMRGRIYDPKVGRFLQTDPIVSHPLFSQSWNAYSYVLNSPLNLVDPTGFQDAPPPPPPSDPPPDPPNNAGVQVLPTMLIIGQAPTMEQQLDGVVNGLVTGTILLPEVRGEDSTTVVVMPPTSWVDNPYVQIEGGFVAGTGLGVVPFAGIAEQVLTGGGVLATGTREARQGKAVGEMLGGMFAAASGVTGGIVGTGISFTGVGAFIGVPVAVVSGAVALGGTANVAAGISQLSQAFATGSGSGRGLRPEAKYEGSRKHGIQWREALPSQRAARFLKDNGAA
jgi:RHS repeat-associated protein